MCGHVCLSTQPQPRVEAWQVDNTSLSILVIFSSKWVSEHVPRYIKTHSTLFFRHIAYKNAQHSLLQTHSDTLYTRVHVHSLLIRKYRFTLLLQGTPFTDTDTVSLHPRPDVSGRFSGAWYIPLKVRKPVTQQHSRFAQYLKRANGFRVLERSQSSLCTSTCPYVELFYRGYTPMVQVQA